VLRDLRYAARVLLRSPGYALVVIAVLAIGIGTNLVAFGAYKALALTPVAGVANSADLHVITATTTAGRRVALSHQDYEFLRDRLDRYDGLAGANLRGFTVGTGATARRAMGEMVTGNYFQVLGVGAQVGRTLLPSDDAIPRAHPVVVLSDFAWRRDFGGDPGIVGTTLQVSNVPMTIIGVAAADFHGTTVGIEMELFVPVMMQPALSNGWDALANPDAELLFAIGRPRSGVTLEQARAAAAVAGKQLAAERIADRLADRATVLPIQESPAGTQTYAQPVVRLLGATSVLLLIVVCANVAGLVLVRGISRRGEIATRLAVGASRGRIARLLLIENLLLAVPGAAIGFQLRLLAEPYLTSAPADSFGLTMHFNWNGGLMFGAAVVLACVSALLCGLLPALQATRVDLAASMKDSLSARGPSTSRLRNVLVAGQVAMALVLLVTMALVIRSLEAAREANPGFDPRNVASVLVDLRSAGYNDRTGPLFYERLTRDMRAMEGVETVSLLDIPLLMLWELSGRAFTVEGRAAQRRDDTEFGFNVVSAEHFRTLRIPLIAGRDFDPRDDRSALPVVIVNETLATAFWGTAQNAVGRRVRSRAWVTDVPQWFTIVGVARDIKYTRLTEQPRPYVYFPSAQAYVPTMFVHVRSQGPLTGLVARVRARVQALDPRVPILDARMLQEQTNMGLAVYEAAARILAVVGAAAIALAALGVYGLVAYAVKQNTQEIGIRVAIGAPRLEILQRFLVRGLRVGISGALVGIVAAIGTARLMSTLLYGVGASDVMSFVAAIVVVLAATLAASLVPAWRAARVEPLKALRHL
jgi:predicted permease